MTNPIQDEWQSDDGSVRLLLGDCCECMASIADASVDSVVTDPPYPEIDRPYGRMTEAEWFDMMRVVVAECRRILKPSGSAVFILQANSERVGKMRTWLWEFQAWVGKEWGIVQDAYWWNYAALPLTKNDSSFLRGSVKACVWCGAPTCYRDVSRILWTESEANRAMRENARCTDKLQTRTSGATVRDNRMRNSCVDRGGVQPFNLIPIGSDGKTGDYSHPARTPLELASWWLRYVTPDNGTTLDPFVGSGTVVAAAKDQGLSAIGIEKMPEYFETAKRRILSTAGLPLFRQTAPMFVDVGTSGEAS